MTGQWNGNQNNRNHFDSITKSLIFAIDFSPSNFRSGKNININSIVPYETLIKKIVEKNSVTHVSRKNYRKLRQNEGEAMEYKFN